MSVQRYVTPAGKVRYRARVKSHGQEVAARVFERRADAIAWEQEQGLKLRQGDWHDPRRGKLQLGEIATLWLTSRASVKRRTYETDAGNWRRYIEPKWAKRQISSITASQIATWLGELADQGLARSTIARILATLRSVLAFAVDDRRIALNPASIVTAPAGGQSRREGQNLDLDELLALTNACRGRYADVVPVLGLQGLRWGELAGLQVGDLFDQPAPGMRIARAVLSSGGGGELFIDSLKNKRARTVPTVPLVQPILDRWRTDKTANQWLFNAPRGGPMSERNWKRSVQWKNATTTIGRPELRVHDLRHTAASIWLASGADPKVVQRVLGHASAAMTMDLYGHMIDHSLWGAAKRIGNNGGISGAREHESRSNEAKESQNNGSD